MENPPEPMAGRRHALLIGIEEYPYAKGPALRGPYNDVIVVKALLRDRFGFPADNLLILRDREATQAGIRTAFEEMIKRVAENEIFVCFYSGHHDDANMPTDDPEKVDYEKAEKISRLAYEVTMELANREVLW